MYFWLLKLDLSLWFKDLLITYWHGWMHELYWSGTWKLHNYCFLRQEVTPLCLTIFGLSSPPFISTSFICPSLSLSLSCSFLNSPSVYCSVYKHWIAVVSLDRWRVLSFSFSPWINYQREQEAAFLHGNHMVLAFVGDRNGGACEHLCVDAFVPSLFS